MSALRKFGKVAGFFILVGAVLAAAYFLFLRPWDHRWGAFRAEAVAFMPGDQLVAKPNFVVTRAVVIRGAPEEIWPWLVQMGYQRGGLYSYDWIDRFLGILDRPSAVRILPDFQTLEADDIIPIGRNPGWPVSSVDPNRSLVLNIVQDPVHFSWSFLLKPLSERATRLVLRIRGRFPLRLRSIPSLAFMDVGEFPMVRKMLTGIRDRVENNAETPTNELIELSLWAAAVVIGLIALTLAFARRKWLRHFVLAWLSFVAVVGLAYFQPEPIIGGAAVAVLLVWLTASFGYRKRKQKII